MKTVHPSECELDIDVMNWNLPLESCEGFVGFHFEVLGEELIPRGKEIIRYYKDSCD